MLSYSSLVSKINFFSGIIIFSWTWNYVNFLLFFLHKDKRISVFVTNQFLFIILFKLLFFPIWIQICNWIASVILCYGRKKDNLVQATTVICLDVDTRTDTCHDNYVFPSKLQGFSHRIFNYCQMVLQYLSTFSFFL